MSLSRYLFSSFHFNVRIYLSSMCRLGLGRWMALKTWLSRLFRFRCSSSTWWYCWSSRNLGPWSTLWLIWLIPESSLIENCKSQNSIVKKKIKKTLRRRYVTLIGKCNNHRIKRKVKENKWKIKITFWKLIRTYNDVKNLNF